MARESKYTYLRRGDSMTCVYTLEQIKNVCRDLNFSPAIEAGFAAYSRGQVVVPPVGELSFVQPPGDTHIKYGYIKSDDCFVVKIASGFYDNVKNGLPSNSGVLLIFSQKTGFLQTILLDEGYLTDVRTAIAGQIAAKYLAPSTVTVIGVLGTGIQARMQVSYLRSVTPCREVVVWGRSEEALQRYQKDMIPLGFHVTTTREIADAAARCNLLITATPSQCPLLEAEMIRPGTHITAMGADTPHKQELATGILAQADLVVADSIPQCLERGEIAKAVQARQIAKEDIVELGAIITGDSRGRTSDQQVTVIDLTGVAVQDIQIAKAVNDALTKG